MDNMFKKNREKFINQMENGVIYIAFAGKNHPRTADQPYPFTPRRNFYYLTGIKDPVIILTIFKDADGKVIETLYLERYDEKVAKWDGAVINTEKAQELSGIENFREIERFETDMGRLFFSTDALKVQMDLENRYFASGTTAEGRFAAKIKDSYPHIVIENAYPAIVRLRTTKSDEEVALIKKACGITGEAIVKMMQNSRPGMMEYELTAHFDFHLRMSGVKETSFSTIAASGRNATILHYQTNDAQTKDGDLILFDLGAQWNYYAADISRTFSENGKSTERQKELYNIVLAVQKKVIGMMKDGVEYKDLNQAVKDYYAVELKRIGLIKEDAEVSKYYYHGVSHHLGLDVHDPNRMTDGILRKGMVLTVEPGLYVAEENIGIRIEDNVLVTEDGAVVLSEGIPKTVEEIEAVMKK